MTRLLAMLALAAVLATGPPATATPGPARAPEYWFDQWHVAQLWRDGARGQGVTIAQIDTGVNATLPELSGRVLPGIDFGRLGGNGHTDRDIGEFGHGTAMASIAVGRPGTLGVIGLAPGARLLPVAVPLRGTTDASADDRLPEAIRWAADHGAKIISMALGQLQRPSESAAPCPADIQGAILYALGKGSVLFASNGNRGRTDDGTEAPGVCLGVVSVGAVGRSGAVADFSSRHRYLTMTAPGVDVASLGRVAGSVYSGGGASQATTIAAAVAALVWSKHPSLSGPELIARLMATLDRRRASADPAYGYGTVNAFRAVRAPASAVRARAIDPVDDTVGPFLARQRALAITPPVPPGAAPHTQRPPGAFAIGSRPRPLARQVLHGLLVSGSGLLALLALAVLGWARRRRASGGEAATSAGGVTPPPEPLG